jgi:putative hydrolase of the HAD superfamily
VTFVPVTGELIVCERSLVLCLPGCPPTAVIEVRIWDPRLVQAAEDEARLPRGAIFDVAFSPDLLESAITGGVTDEVWRRQVSERLQQQFPGSDGELAVQLWSESTGDVDTEVLGLVRNCRSSCTVILISNATTRLKSDLEALGITGEFDYIINSSEVGFAKPDRRVFSSALGRIGLLFAEALFIDDSVSHVQAAQSMGLCVHHYSGIDPLRKYLEELGVLRV